MDRNILQLREYHINRGKNKSSAPIYPITKAECIIGEIGGSGVTKVDVLPATGEEGKIYYNTTTKQYYTYDGNIFVPLAAQGMPIGEAPENINDSPNTQCTYVLRPNVFYDFDEFYTTDTTLAPKPATINFSDIDNENVANSYVFRMTIPTSGTMNINMQGPIITDSAKEILDALETGHTYEFNVFHGVLLITDITATV